jgi:hypothetical protein
VNVRRVQILDVPIDATDGTDHGILVQDLHDRADQRGEEREEEVDDVLACLCV